MEMLSALGQMTRYAGLLTSQISSAGTLLPVTGDLYFAVSSDEAGREPVSGIQTCFLASLPVSIDSVWSTFSDLSPRK